jgi:tRNA (guanine37-N1)-methyltransferase
MGSLLKCVLKPVLNDDEITKLYSAFDIIGEIAIIRIPDELYDKKEIIGNAILNNIKHIRSVYMQNSPVKDLYRIRELECIAGVDNPITIYKEHGCKFKLNVKSVYFSPRLSNERKRLTDLVNNNEIIINMFAGVGTFSIIIAKYKACKVYSIDINDEAYKYTVENVKINKVSDRVIPLLGNARDVIRANLINVADRVLMPLPEYAKEYISDAILALKDHGIIHYFTHIHADNKLDAINRSKDEMIYIMQDYKYSVINAKVVRAVGPRLYQLVLDLEVYK